MLSATQFLEYVFGPTYQRGEEDRFQVPARQRRRGHVGRSAGEEEARRRRWRGIPALALARLPGHELWSCQGTAIGCERGFEPATEFLLQSLYITTQTQTQAETYLFIYHHVRVERMMAFNFAVFLFSWERKFVFEDLLFTGTTEVKMEMKNKLCMCMWRGRMMRYIGVCTLIILGSKKKKKEEKTKLT